ncbi:glycosyltransferase family 2 protein [Robertkochia aurantiaca]|uniref:glycosyltransferase family 2 protein n=1 Tax=Robertkochia aurantiaca TaxID=2873700 RepID=UPI001CCB15BB|nr:glycosyltransferase [Robertkochia sp. 3YJGBD-33]
MTLLNDITSYITLSFLIYGFLVGMGYLFSAVFSFFEIREYKRSSKIEKKVVMLQSSNLPSISILAPAYNEAVNIVDNIRSLLTINYPSYEIIIINDGSTDNTLPNLIRHFNLEQTELVFLNNIPTRDVRKVYKSKNKAFEKLLVIDKKNGGKADALNTGINAASHDYFCAIDVDCILADDALLKLVRPFLNDKKKVIASGGIIRVANACEIQGGRIVSVRLPKGFLERVQILEYLRAFLMGRMAWSRADGLLLISGAFGLFDKETVIDAGGYNTQTVGEDMELLVRMRRMMHKRKTAYKVGFIPDPLCWTEVPNGHNILIRQRNRWTRGTIETLWIHRGMLFNLKYRVLGVLSMPYWLFFEWLAPLIEGFGLLFFILLLSLGLVNWVYAISFMAAAYGFAVLYSITAIYFEEISFQQYKKPKYIYKLVLTALLEPILYHPLVFWSALRGNIDLLRGKKSWGQMTRQGFDRIDKAKN